MDSISGLAADVPFIALPPESGPAPAPLVVVWHMVDPPRTPRAMSSALPLKQVDAWRVYLSLPMTGDRAEAEPADDADPLLDFFTPVLEQASAEFPAVLTDLRRRLPAEDGPVRLVGASLSALIAQSVLTDTDLPVGAVALVSPAVTLAGLIAANENAFGMTYPWDDKSRAIAGRYDFIARAGELVKRNVPMLLVVGEEDTPEFREPARKLWQALTSQGEPADYSMVGMPGLGHALAEEPGVEAAPQTAHAARVDAAVSDWFSRH